MSDEEKTPQGKEPIPAIDFHFGKSNFFRVIYADGAVGGISPRNGMLQVSFFSERVPIPTKITHSLVLKNSELQRYKIGPEVPDLRETKDGIYREVEVDVVMTLQTAKELHIWLTDKIKELEKHHGIPNA